jgi:hypothetical protein
MTKLFFASIWLGTGLSALAIDPVEELKAVLTPSQLQAFISLHQSKRKHHG